MFEIANDVKVVDADAHDVEGARVAVISVHNAGQQAVSNQRGTATLHTLVCGPMTIRVAIVSTASALVIGLIIVLVLGVIGTMQRRNRGE